MKKLFAFMLSLIIIISFINVQAFAETSTKALNPVKVKLNDEYLNFDVDPIIVNDRTMVPMRAIFEYLGSHVLWYGDTKTVIGYKDNMFIKLKIGSPTAYKNGKSFTLDSPPIIRNSRTLVPIRFVAESFGMIVDWDGENRTVLLSYDKEINNYRVIDDILFKSVNLKEYGLEFMIPDHWSKSENSDLTFRYENEEDKVEMNVQIVNLEKQATLDEFTEQYKESILNAYKNNVIFTGNNKIKVNNIDINVVRLKNSSVNPEINQVMYFFTTEDLGYIISFSYYTESNDSQLLNVFNNIINTVEISSITVDFTEEYYVEYDKFFETGMKLESEVYSNMEVQNKFPFKGSVEKDSSMDYLFVQVNKDNESMELKVPVESQKFDSNIYTPFGLGKHNIIVGTPIDENSISHYIMQFSVINTSNEDIRYLIPSRFVETNDPEIVALAGEITKGYYNEYDKAKAIYKWIAENIEYDLEVNSDTPRSAKQTLTDKKGDCDEISYLYTALLRASDIQARIVSGKKDEENHAWNEIMVNGKWIIADATWGSGYFNGEAYVKELDMSYFNPDRSDYEKQFTDIEYLTY